MLGGDVVTGHDLKTGEEIWRMTGFNPTNDSSYRTIASAVYQDGIVFAPTRERPLQAFKIGGRGDITKSNLLWQFNNGPGRADAGGGREILLFGQRSRHRVVPGREDRQRRFMAASG